MLAYIRNEIEPQQLCHFLQGCPNFFAKLTKYLFWPKTQTIQAILALKRNPNFLVPVLCFGNPVVWETNINESCFIYFQNVKFSGCVKSFTGLVCKICFKIFIKRNFQFEK
jgi:hypothetical protein